jgi:hypothetical protein
VNDSDVIESEFMIRRPIAKFCLLLALILLAAITMIYVGNVIQANRCDCRCAFDRDYGALLQAPIQVHLINGSRQDVLPDETAAIVTKELQAATLNDGFDIGLGMYWVTLVLRSPNGAELMIPMTWSDHSLQTGGIYSINDGECWFASEVLDQAIRECVGANLTQGAPLIN